MSATFRTMFLDGTWWLYNTQYSRVQYEYSTCTGTITVEKEGIWTGIARTPENQAYYQSYGTNTYILVQLIQYVLLVVQYVDKRKYSIPKGTLIQTTQISLIRVGQGLSSKYDHSYCTRTTLVRTHTVLVPVHTVLVQTVTF